MEGANPEFQEAVFQIYFDMIAFVERILKKGQEAGQIRNDLDARTSALNIILAMKGNSCSPEELRGEDSYLSMMETLRKIILDGLRV